MFDSHPPLAERIAILRKLEGLDPDGRGPVDETITGVPVDLDALAHVGRTGAPQPAPVADRRPGREHADRSPAPTRPPTARPMMIPKPGASPPGWFRRDATTLRYWNGNVFTDWTATWNGTRWVQSRAVELTRSALRAATSW